MPFQNTSDVTTIVYLLQVFWLTRKLHTFSRSRMYPSCVTRYLHLFPTHSAREQEIIEHPSSCYVIGRSGTGKTTTMLFKMLSIQRTWQQYPDIRPKPRQVFITQSRVLAMKVDEYFAKLMSSLEAAAYSPEELREIEKDAEREIEFIDQDDNKQWRPDLPERFSELLDENFPLFITYDRVRASLSSEHLISLSHDPVSSSAQCYRMMLSKTTIMTASLFQWPMSLMRLCLPRVQHHPASLDCVQGLGARPRLITCNSSVGASFLTENFWHLIGITSRRPSPGL